MGTTSIDGLLPEATDVLNPSGYDEMSWQERSVYWRDKYTALVGRLIKSTRTPAPSLGEVDSGMSGDAVTQAEWFWAQLPTARPWTSLQTYEKALVCHMLARAALSSMRPVQEDDQ